MTALVLVETVLLAVLTVLVAGLLRGYGTVLRRLHELERPGTAGRQFELLPLRATPATSPVVPAVEGTGPAFDITGETLSGEVLGVAVTGVEHDTLLLFLSSGCASCATFWAELREPMSLPPRTRLLVVAQDAAQESVAELGALAPAGVDVVLSTGAWRDYEVPGSPHVVFVDGPSGRIRGEGTGQSLHQVAQLLARSTGDLAFVGGTARDLRKPAGDLDREADVDRELLAAGIVPGDPRLYGTG